MSLYPGVGWWNDETHNLSQANMKTIDQGIKDAHLLDVAEVTSGTEASLELTVPAGATGLRIQGVFRSDFNDAWRGLSMTFNNNTADDYRSQRVTFSGDTTTPIVLMSELNRFGVGDGPGATALAGVFATVVIDIPNVQASSGFRPSFTAQVQASNTTNTARITMSGGHQVNQAGGPVSTIQLFVGDAAFVAGTRFELL